MANWNVLKAAVANIINANGNQEITGQLLQNILNNIITNVGENATFAGIATLNTNPGAPDGPVFYLATTAGVYPNFNGLEVLDGEAIIFLWNNSAWTKKVTGFATNEKLSQLGSYTYNIPVDKKGYYIKRKDGEIAYTGDKKFCVSEFINVVEGDIFIIENATELASSQSYALYDENKNLILLSNVPDIILTIPNGVKYVVFSRNTNADLSNQYKCRRVFNKYLDMLFYIGDKSVYIRKATFITREGAFDDKATSLYISTDYISVKPSQILCIKGKAENLAVLYAFYREDKTLISTGLTEGVVRVPENAYYVAACSDKSADFSIRPVTTEYTDYKFDNYVGPLNTKVGKTNFYKHRANVGHSIEATTPNYILINVPNIKKTICGIQFKIATFMLDNFSQKNVNVLAYFYPTPETAKGLSYASVQVQGDTALDIKYLIKDGSFYIAIPKGTILNKYSGIYVDSLFSWFSAPVITNDSDNIIISEADNIDDYNVAYEYSYTPKKDISNVTNLDNIYRIQNHLEGTYANLSEYLTYPVADYSAWTDGKTGACVIKFPIYNSNSCLFELDINVFRYQTRGCTLKVCGFYTAGFQGEKFVRVVSGSLNTIYGKLRAGFHDNRICIILGDTANKWQFLKFDISNVRTYMNSSKPTPFTEGWNLEFVSDLTDYNVEDVDYKIDEEILPNIPASKINNFGEEVRKVLLKSNALSKYVDVNYIRTGLSKFFKKLYAKEKNTPYNLLFLGDSITNFQDGWASGADKELPKVSNNKPLCMYNEYTFTNRLWALLNPNALDRANRNKVFGGNMTFIKATSNDVVKSGTWVNSYNYATGQYNLPTIGGHPGGIKDFLFSTDSDAYLEFTIPANSKGFSVVAEVQNGAKTYNSTSYNPSTSVEVTLDGVLLDTISMIPESPYTQYQKRFDFVIASPTASTRKVRIQNKEANKWVFIWGVESWTDSCVRPINNAFAGASMFGSGNYNNHVFAYTPDMIVHEANLLNDTRVDLVATEKLYDTFYSKLSEKGIPILVLVTHAPSSSSTSITVDADKCPNMEDAEQTPRYYNQYAAMIKRVCGRYNIPYINVFQYQYDLYNGVIPSDLFVDGIHLSAKGHDMYKLLIDYAFENNY